MESLKSKFLIGAWALYDLANQFFALNIVSLYFVRWITLDKGTPEIFYSISFGISTFFVAILAPVFGKFSDLTKKHRVFLTYFTLLSVIFTVVLGIPESISLNLLFFALANFGCQMAVVFYNALMINIAPRDKIGLISGLGRMSSYIGAILAMHLVKPAVLKSGYQAAFLPTGILFLIFSLPCLIFVKDKKLKQIREIKLADLFAFDAYKIYGLSNFLKAMFFGLCAINIIMLFMSVYVTTVFKLNEHQVINLISVSTVFAIAGSLFSGFISDYLGYRRSLCAVFILWAVCFSLGAIAKTTYLYLLVGGLVGIALGSIWAISRAIAIKLVPEEKIGELFGLFNLVAYSSAVVGALYWGILLLLLSPLGDLRYRIALLSLVLFMLLGLIFLFKDLPRGAGFTNSD